MPASPNSSAGDPEPTPTLTRELLARYLAGDFAAETRLFGRVRAGLLERARTHPRLRPIARYVTAEDVVQEVLWRALSSGLLHEFEDQGSGSLERVMSVILDRTLVDFGRRHGAQRRGGNWNTLSLDRAPASEVPHRIQPCPQETTPTSNARSNEIQALCQRSLEPREWQAWELVEFGGLDSNEAAARLGLTSSAVRGLLLRARAKLVRALESKL